MFKDLKITEDEVVYRQLSIYIKMVIDNGFTTRGTKLPSSRELGKILSIGRNSVIQAYEELSNDGYIRTVKGKGTFVIKEVNKEENNWRINWEDRINEYGRVAFDLDIVKNELVGERDFISFKSIAPSGNLFDLEEVKKAFHNRLAIEEHKILNYGYAKGYKPLIEYLIKYLNVKGIENSQKDLLITNGFTEAFDMVLATFCNKGDYILCENPTHNTAIKIMKSYGLKIVGIEMKKDGINIEELKRSVEKYDIKFAYLTPSYHNPTGVVTSLTKRTEIYNILKERQIPIIEDGFNEELFYESSHIASIAALEGSGKGVIYIGSFSKVLFPGIRIGWVYGDKYIIDILESVKRCRNIHTSFLDQALLYDYLNSGSFEKYIKKIRRVYKEKYEFTIRNINKYIGNVEVWGQGGLYVYISINNIDTRELLNKCYKCGVLFMDSSIFDIKGKSGNSIRLGFTRLSNDNIDKGLRILGRCIKDST